MKINLSYGNTLVRKISPYGLIFHTKGSYYGIKRRSKLDCGENSQPVISVKEYLESSEFKIPEGHLIYKPTGMPDFCFQGEKMVNNLLQVAPVCSVAFDKRFPVSLQREIATKSFRNLSD